MTNKLKLLTTLGPKKLIQAINNRGLRGAMVHGVRRLGTVMEHPLAGPDMLRINPLSYICNHRCPMCGLQHLEPDELRRGRRIEKRQALALAEYVALFESMPRGLRRVELVGGGEPLAHPNAVDIMAEVKKRGWIGSLISNGTLLSDPVARELVAMRWDITRISVHAGDRQTYTKIHGVDHFDIMLKNLKHFNRLRCERGLKEICALNIFHAIQRDNISSIDKLFSVAEEIGADSIQFDPVIALDHKHDLTIAEFEHAKAGLLSCARSSNIPCNLDEILAQLAAQQEAVETAKPFMPAARCSVGFDQTHISSLGNVEPCCFSPEVMGNLRDHSFKEIWGNETYQRFRKRLINGQFPRYCIESRCPLTEVLHN